MAALELKDLTNLPFSLPISQIPQGKTVSQTLTSNCHRLQPHPALQKTQFHPQQRRVASLSSNDSGYELMDDSLTDMQWLQRMDAGSDFPGLTHVQCRNKLAKGHRAMGKDGCRKKLDYTSKKGTNKPPLSYASLIALAICSTPQRMMTLSSIYRWIEYTFPFYRTPEAKAWKNSIRHNLSIRKNMFMKVFQYPPRRGNGSYWTLLSDGEEELKKAIPLFATLQPPVIDSNSTYHREPSTHTVKSKGKFVPVLPRSDASSGGLPYFSFSGNLSGANSSRLDINEVEVCESEELSASGDQFGLYGRVDKFPRQRKRVGHMCDHSYAKSWHLKEEVREETEVVELAAGNGGLGKVSQWGESFTDISTPKRKRKAVDGERSSNNPAITITDDSNADHVGSPSFATPPKEEQDNSLHLLDSSFLTPLKNMAVPDVEIGTISFSPLYANLITPKPDKIKTRTKLESSLNPFFPSPLTPLRSTLDSGIFSPLRTDCLGGLKFSTPTNSSSLSPLADLSAFSSLQPELYSFKVLDNSSSLSNINTPIRPGSLQGLGLPGFTPPSRK